MARERAARARLGPAVAVLGGALIELGVFLPWLSLYAGLQPLRGVIGLYGRMLAVGGAVCLAIAVWSWLRPTRGLGRAMSLLGAVLAGFAAWLVVQLMATYRTLEPMLVPRLGPGLFVVLAGALLVTAGAIRPWPSAMRTG